MQIERFAKGTVPCTGSLGMVSLSMGQISKGERSAFAHRDPIFVYFFAGNESGKCELLQKTMRPTWGGPHFWWSNSLPTEHKQSPDLIQRIRKVSTCISEWKGWRILWLFLGCPCSFNSSQWSVVVHKTSDVISVVPGPSSEPTSLALMSTSRRTAAPAWADKRPEWVVDVWENAVPPALFWYVPSSISNRRDTGETCEKGQESCHMPSASACSLPYLGLYCKCAPWSTGM